MKKLLLLIIPFVFSCQPNNDPKPPLVDGSIDDFKALGVEPITIGYGVNLYLYQDQHYVWVAYDYPESSFGTIDLQLVAPALEDTINLHVSAQIGEWMVEEGTPRPENPESGLWWNHKGWYANEVWINGMDTTGGKTNYRFKNAPAREIQLSKERFGRGTWNFKMNIRAIRTPGGFSSSTFPKDDTFYSLTID